MTCVVVPSSASDSILDVRIVTLIQAQLSTLSWVNACYGIAELAEMKKDDGSIERFPRVCANLPGQPVEYKDVRYDDSIGAQLFFEREGDIVMGEGGEQDQVSYPLSIVGWANLKVVDPNRNYDFTDLLAGDVVRILRYYFDSNIDSEEIRIELRSEQAYSKYSLSDVENRFRTLPYTVFKISFEYTEFNSGACYEFAPLPTGIGSMVIEETFTIA